MLTDLSLHVLLAVGEASRAAAWCASRGLDLAAPQNSPACQELVKTEVLRLMDGLDVLAADETGTTDRNDQQIRRACYGRKIARA